MKTFLGRPWRAFAATTYLNTEMSANVRPEGWNNWGRPDREKTARYSEYNSAGPGGENKSRAAWSQQLSQSDADAITKEKVLTGADGWRP